jgi:putative FmdB family regulatory protein
VIQQVDRYAHFVKNCDMVRKKIHENNEETCRQSGGICFSSRISIDFTYDLSFWSTVDRMPTYTYRCKSCSYEFEEFQSISSDALKTCPSCKQDALVRVFDVGTGLVFKGSGFYLTDYKKSGSSPASTKKETTSDPTPAPPKETPPAKS